VSAVPGEVPWRDRCAGSVVHDEEMDPCTRLIRLPRTRRLQALMADAPFRPIRLRSVQRQVLPGGSFWEPEWLQVWSERWERQAARCHSQQRGRRWDIEDTRTRRRISRTTSTRDCWVFARTLVRTSTSRPWVASRMPPEVLEAMVEANEYFVDMHELIEAAGARVAELMGAEAAIVTSGGFASLLLGSAACLTGSGMGRIERIVMVLALRGGVPWCTHLGREWCDGGVGSLVLRDKLKASTPVRRTHSYESINPNVPASVRLRDGQRACSGSA
jgi:hypothetical protein